MIDGLYQRRHPPALIRLLWLLVTVTIVYLSLYPLAGWRLRQPSMWSFLGHGVPRFYTYADIVANVAAYVIFGLLFALGWFIRRRPWLVALLAGSSGVLLSLVLESLQSYLPTRVPSLLDFYANAFGAVAGGVIGAAVGHFRARGEGTPSQVSLQWYEQGPAIGWALLVVWLLCQLPTQRLLFSTGHLTRWLTETLPGLAALLPSWPDGAFPEAFRSMLETGVITTMMSVLGILVMDLIRSTGARVAWIAGLLAAGLLLRMASSTQVYSAGPLSAWLTSGAQAGLVLGTLALYLIGAFRRPTRLAIGAGLVVLAVLLVNGAPADPFFQTTVSGTRQALTPALTPSLRSLISALGAFWPVLVLLYFLLRLVTLRRIPGPRP